MQVLLIAGQEGTAPEGTTPPTNFLQQAVASSVFLYPDGSTPCDPPPPGSVLFPSGSGFVVGISKKRSAGEAGWLGWKFIVTAKHVVVRRDGLILRLNRSDKPEFTCVHLPLKVTGKDQNVFFAPVGVDLAAISIPEIPDTDPTVFGYSMILDATKMTKAEITVGTELFAVGYLWGYSGQKQNYPVTKVGRISVLTNERWLLNPSSRQLENAFLVELQGTPGLSGAPVMTHGVEFKLRPFAFRELRPYVIGVVKGLLTVPVNRNRISQGLVAVEPGKHVKTETAPSSASR